MTLDPETVEAMRTKIHAALDGWRREDEAGWSMAVERLARALSPTQAGSGDENLTSSEITNRKS